MRGPGALVPPLEIPPEPPPGGTTHEANMGADERSREGVVDRQGLEGEEESEERRERVGSAEGKRRGRTES